jgi:sugar/nucleoside kinase (ribokinase family)
MRHGILTAGNFLIDFVKLIDDYPEENMLTLIRSQTKSNGGEPYNMLINLARMQAKFPLQAAALLGDDANGRWILDDLKNHGIDTSLIRFTTYRSTSFTDFMTNAKNGRRTFFHDPGTNAFFDGQQIDFTKTNAKLFHLGLLMILEKLDSFAEDGQTHAAHLLQRATAAGLITSIDLVSTPHPDFRAIALSAFPHSDFILINEIEAGKILNTTLAPDDATALAAATHQLIQLGIRRAAVIHTEHGAWLTTHTGETLHTPSLNLPEGYIQGANGAGDAFATGFLYGIHEDWDYERCLHLAIRTATACLSHPTPSGGLKPIDDCLTFKA